MIRFTLIVQRDEERIAHFKLTPEPASLFREDERRKPAKYILRNYLLQAESKNECSVLKVAVNDGGDFSTHHAVVKIHRNAANYLRYINDHFKQPTICIVFDGNNDPNSTKGEEHNQSTSKMQRPNVLKFHS